MTNMFGNTPTKEEIEQLTEERDTILNSKNNSQIELEQVQAKLADVITDLDTQKDALAVYRRDVEALKETKNELLDDTDELEQKVRSTNATLNSLNTRISAVENNATIAEKELESKKEAIATEIATRREEANGIILDLDKQIIDREKTTDELSSTIEKLNQDIAKKTAELEKLHEEVSIAAEVMNSVQAERQYAESELEKTKLQIVEQKEAQAKKLIDIEAAISALEEQKTIVVTELKKEMDKLATAQKEADEVADGLKNHRQAIINLNRKEERIRDFCDENGIDHSKL